MDMELQVVKEEFYDAKKDMEGEKAEEKRGIITTEKKFLNIGISIEDGIEATGLFKTEIERDCKLSKVRMYLP